MEEQITVSKIDVSARQLQAAVRLFFRKADPIPIETLAGAALSVLRGLAKQFGLRSIIHDSELIAPEKKHEWISLLHVDQNFFKHADRDAQQLLVFRPRSVHFTLIEACDLFRRLVAERHVSAPLPREILLFEIWFSFKYPHLLSNPDALRRLLPPIALEIDPDDFSLFHAVLDMPDT